MIDMDEANAADNEGTTEQICCLVDDGKKCLRTAGNASYSKKIQKTVSQRKLKFQLSDQVTHIYICEYHKEAIHSVRQIKPRKRHGSEHESSPEIDTKPKPEVNFLAMPVNTLRKYKRHFKLTTRPGLNKSQLAEAVLKHFRGMDVDEKEVLTIFIYMAKNNYAKNDNSLAPHTPLSSPSSKLKFLD